MPYSRATMELWLSGPPTSVTTPAAMANNDVQAGVVMLATSTSPGSSFPKSSGPREYPGGGRDHADARADADDHVAVLVLRRRSASIPASPRTTPLWVTAAGGVARR